MSTVTVYRVDGGTAGQLDVPDALLELKRGGQAVHDAVVAHLNALRAGTASTLTKAEVAGSGRKPWRQKGTGQARAGYRQSPVWRGGGIVFGPKPRCYAQKVNRKVATLAFRRALSEKITAGELRVIEELGVGEAKTKKFVGILKALKVKAPLLLVVDKADRNLLLAARNVPRVEVCLAREATVYQLLRYPLVLVNKGGMDELTQRLQRGRSEKSR